MDVPHPYFTKQELSLVNRMRTHLQLYYVSDMTGLAGRRTLGNIKQCVNYRGTKWEWPKQPLPAKAKNVWARACEKIGHHLQTHRLGCWFRRNQIWLWKLSADGTRLRNANGDVYKLTNGRYGDHYEKSADDNSECKTEVDVYYARHKLCVDKSPINIQPNTKKRPDIYNEFFESHELPRRMEKKIVRLLKRVDWFTALT